MSRGGSLNLGYGELQMIRGKKKVVKREMRETIDSVLCLNEQVAENNQAFFDLPMYSETIHS